MVVAATLVFGASAQAQTAVQVPFASTIAGLAPGSGATACSSSNDIPTFSGGTITGVHIGDGCVPTQATLSTAYMATSDSLGNIYIADYGHLALRVIYNGGAALKAAIIAANPYWTNLSPVPTVTVGRIYTIGGGSRTAAISKTGTGTTMYYCNSNGSGTVSIDTSSVGGDGCPASQTYIGPRTIALDKDGNIFFTSTKNGQSVRVIYVGGTTAANLIKLENPGVTPQVGFLYDISSQAAGNGWNGDGGLAKAAAMYSVRDVAVDANENIYISDGAAPYTAPATASDNMIRVIYAGNGPIPGLTSVPSPVAGYMYTLAGGAGCTYPNTTGCVGTNPTGNAVAEGANGPALSATFNSPYGLVLDANANVYVADYSNAIVREIYQGTGTIYGVTNPQKGYIYTIAGGGATSAATLAASGTLATSLAFGIVSVAGLDTAGNLYLYDTTNKYMWKVNPATGVAIIVGGLGTGTAAIAGNFCAGTSGPTSTDTGGDGCPATEVALNSNGQYTFDQQGNFYETESTNAVVRKFSLNTQFAGTAVGSTLTQPLAFATLSSVTGFTGENFTLQGGTTTEFSDGGTDSCNTVTVSTVSNTTCVYNVKFAPAQAGLREGAVSFTVPVASSWLSGVGQAATASIDPGTQTTIGTGLQPNGVGTDLLGNLYIADTLTNTVKKVAAAGGTPVTLISGLNNPAQVAVDGKGNVYVADTGNNRIAMTSSAGGTITALGTGLSAPTGVAVDGLGNVYVADTGNNRIVKIYAIGGQKAIALTGTNTPVPARLALDGAGDLFVTDTANSSVLELATNASQTSLNLGTSTFVPSAVTVDTAGDVYVTDATNKQVLEYLNSSTGLSTTSTALITGLVTPVGIASDVNGSVYIADTGLSFPAASVTAYSVTSNVVTVIANNNFIAGMKVTFSGLTGATFLNGQTLTVLTTALTGAQFQVAFTHANTAGADAGTATPTTPVGAIAIKRVLTTVNFPITNLNQSSPAAITFTDTGNLPLSFTGTQFATATGSTTQFSLAAPTANGCALATPVAAGTSCLLTATFTPTAAGTYAETISPVTNAANNSSLSGALSGLGVQLISTTTNLTITSPTTTPIYYGQSVVINSSTTLASNGGTPVGTITFTVDGTAQTPIAFGTGMASITLPNLTVGAHSVTVSVVFNPIDGIPVYASSGNVSNFSVSKAATTTLLAITPTTNGAAVGTQFTATVSSATATGETQTVNFYAGSTSTTPLNGTPIPLTNNVAVYSTTTATAAGTYYAVYSGDSNFAGSTSTGVTPSGDFNLTANSTAVSIPQGGNVTAGITVTPYFGYVGTVTPLCSGLPQYALCRYQPVNAAVNGTPIPATITAYSIASNVVTITAANNMVAGFPVAFSGLSQATYLNGQVLTVLSTGLSSSQFQVAFTHANAGGVETGTATPVTTQQFTVVIYTSTNLTAENRMEGTQMALAMLSPLGLAALLCIRRRKMLPRALLLLMLSLAGIAGLNGCGLGVNGVTTTSGVTTPASTQTVTVSFSDNNTPQVSHAISFTLNVCNASVTTSCQTH
jgi:sugar lactone lactonase YvrE